MTLRSKRAMWVLIVVVVGVGVAVGWGSTPTSGTSSDRLYSLAAEMKCLQCVGESVANSQAPIAIQMRAEIGRQMASGKTDDEIETYFVDRYGARVLLNPSGRGLVGVVWVVPVVVMAAGVVGLALTFAARRRDRSEVSPPTDEDRDLVDRARHPT